MATARPKAGEHAHTHQRCRRVGQPPRHLACASDNRPYVVPIRYTVANNYLYSLSMPGQKLDWTWTDPNVCVQVDTFSGRRAWQAW